MPKRAHLPATDAKEDNKPDEPPKFSHPQIRKVGNEHILTLTETFEDGEKGLPITELHFNRLQAGHIKDMGEEMALSEFMAIISKATGLRPDLIDKLGMADLAASLLFIKYKLGPFLGGP